MSDDSTVSAVPSNNGRHLCKGLKGDLPPKIRNYSSFVCSACGGRGAIELPSEDDADYGGKEGDVRDKRRFAHYLDLDKKVEEDRTGGEITLNMLQDAFTNNESDKSE